MSNILFLAHRVPYPPNRGDRIRSFHLLKFLAKRSEVHLAFLTDEAVSAETQQVLDKLCARVSHARLSRPTRWLNGIRSLATGGTATAGLFFSRRLKNSIAAWAAETPFDAVFVFCSSMVQYLETKGLNGVPAVVDLVDVDSQKWFDYAARAAGAKRLLLQLEGRRLRRVERSLPDRVEEVTVVTPQEADVFESFRPDYRPHVLRNGVDLEYFTPNRKGDRNLLPTWPGGCSAQKVPVPFSAESEQPKAYRNDDATPPATSNLQPATTTADSHLLTLDSRFSCVFIGALDYQANVGGATWFCHEIWPQVHLRYPDAVFRLVGSRPNAAARRLGELPGVELVGEVPDIRPYLHRATVVTVPLQVARGVQNKVLEALAAGKPVLVTPQALEGIEATPDTHLMCATRPQQWVEQLSTLFERPDLRDRLSTSGRAFVEQEYRWLRQLTKLSKLPALRCLTEFSQASESLPTHVSHLSEIA